ncbi:MAG: TolC family protein [Calditrichia bacterium]
MRGLLFFTALVFWVIPALFAQETDTTQVLTLNDCIRIALEHNINVGTHQNLAKIADLGISRSYSNILPKINSSFTAGKFISGPSTYLADVPVGIDTATGLIIYEQRTRTSPRYDRSTYSAGISVTQNIFDGGYWWNNIRQNRTLKKAAYFNLKTAENQVVKYVAQYFFDLLKQMKLLEVYSLAMQRSKDQLDRAQQMYEIGSVAQVDVFRARVNYGQDQIAYLNQKNVVRQSRQLLNLAMGRDPLTPIQVSSDLDFQYELPQLDSILETAFRYQPELKSRETDVRAKEFSIALAKSAFLPSLGASFNYSRDHETFEKIYTDLDKNWSMSFGVRLSYNLFNGFADRVNYQSRQIELKNAKLSLVDFKRNLKSDVTNLFSNYKSILEIVEINKKNLEAAREEFRLAEERYRLGSGTSLELREAQVNLTQAEQVLVSAEYNAIITFIELQEAMGTVKQAFKLEG